MNPYLPLLQRVSIFDGIPEAESRIKIVGVD